VYIRLLAQELYRMEREVEDLKKRVDAARPDQRDRLEQQLRKARYERDQLRGRLDAQKSPPSHPTRFR
jgi:uncharacterized protein YicC (UPF0701 family)